MRSRRYKKNEPLQAVRRGLTCFKLLVKVTRLPSFSSSFGLDLAKCRHLALFLGVSLHLLHITPHQTAL